LHIAIQESLLLKLQPCEVICVSYFGKDSGKLDLTSQIWYQIQTCDKIKDTVHGFHFFWKEHTSFDILYAMNVQHSKSQGKIILNTHHV
jgi:hypothetical protein